MRVVSFKSFFRLKGEAQRKPRGGAKQDGTSRYLWYKQSGRLLPAGV